MECEMIQFVLNGKKIGYQGDPELPLLRYLRRDCGITSVKDGCSGQAYCGACMVEVDGKPVLSCVTPLRKVEGKQVYTIEGFPEQVREILGKAFVAAGAVQCGFCSPGFLMRTKILLENNPDPSREEIVQALKFNFCRCTGYVKIIEAVQLAAEALRGETDIVLPASGRVGTRQPKYDAYQKALGSSPFVDDLRFDGMVHGALRFSDHPRAEVVSIDISKAEQMAGVIRIFTAADVPGERFTGLIKQDWPVFVAAGEVTAYIGDVIAAVAAETEMEARAAAAEIRIEYNVLDPVTDPEEALRGDVEIHPGSSNVLSATRFQRGRPVDEVIAESKYVASGVYTTQRIEHAFLETEACIARPWKGGGLEVYSQSQGVYEDRKALAKIVGMPEEKVNVVLVPNGGGFGGKEDLTVQGYTAVFATVLQRPVKVHLSRPESIRMHPKRHPIKMDYTVACDENGMLTAVKADMIGDSGAYASVGMKVMERAAGHGTGAYAVPNVDLNARAVYTNNIPCGAMRGFGVNQATFALESLVDELCRMGGFDRWQFRYDNALVNGSMVATGQILHHGVGVRETLQAVKDEFYRYQYTGLACGMKNTGVGNGMDDLGTVKIEIAAADRVIIYHGWTEMGQGVHTMAQQMLSDKTGIPPENIEVRVATENGAPAGMTTSSRGTSLVGNAILDAVRRIIDDLKVKELKELVGRVYQGEWVCNWTTRPGDPGEVVTHYSYSYATQLVVLDKNGRIDKVVAAHDAGRIMNPTLFEGQIQGSVHMGLGYALTEDLPMENGRLVSDRLRDTGVLRIDQTPEIVVKGVEVHDPYGPFGAKGVGEVGLVPTAGAVANALTLYDGERRYSLPLRRNKK